MSNLLPNPPIEDYPPIGSIWKENDPRSSALRGRKVIGHDYDRGKVQFDGYPRTWAKVERFNGKRGGYTRLDGDGESS